MNAQNRQLLNGTAWGELPAEDELEIPMCLRPEFRQKMALREWRRHEDEARRTAEIGAERARQRKKARAEEKTRKKNAIGAMVFPALCIGIALSLWIVEVICR